MSRRNLMTIATAVLLAAAAGERSVTAAAQPPPQANANLTEIRVLSNRADLISDGNALV
jgi:hypothetical protein